MGELLRMFFFRRALLKKLRARAQWESAILDWHRRRVRIIGPHHGGSNSAGIHCEGETGIAGGWLIASGDVLVWFVEIGLGDGAYYPFSSLEPIDPPKDVKSRPGFWGAA